MGRLRQTAHAQAQAEYGPQKSQVRHQTQSTVHSLRTMQPALEESIRTAREQLRHSGLLPHDLQVALAELAHRNVDVGSSTALQVGQAQREGQQTLVDLSQAQGAAEQGALASLQTAAAQHKQSIQDAIAGEQRGVVTSIKQKILEEQLGLTGSSGGLTPTQKREASSEHHDAAFYAKQLVSQARDGIKDEKTGEWVIPPGPHKWDDTIWNGLVEKVASKDGIDNVAAAQKAVQAVRDHFQPSSGGSGLIEALKTVATPATVALPPALQSIAQAALQRPR